MRSKKSRPAFTVPELVVVLTIAAALMAIAVPRARLQFDRVAVRGALSDVMSIMNSARSLALASHTAVAVTIDSTAGIVRLRRGNEVLLVRNLDREYGVRIGATRDSLAFDAHGLGHGAANLSVFVRHGVIADTIFVSRFGRAR